LRPFLPECLNARLEGFQRGAVCRFFRHAGRHRASVAVDAAIRREVQVGVVELPLTAL
jgi:hypothetical protein